MTLEVSLPADLQQFIVERARADGSRPDECIVNLLRQFKDRESKATLEAKLFEGVQCLDRGEKKRITPEYWNGLRAKIRDVSGEEEHRR